ALGSEQRIPNVAGDLDRGTDETRIRLAIDAAEPHERRTAFGKVIAASIEEAVPKCSCHTGAPIVRGASADPDDDAVSAARRRSEDELSRPSSARDAWVALARLEQRETTRRRHLHPRGHAVAEYFPLRHDPATVLSG